ncbi:MAG: ACP S-malonyltransferase [Conexibacter sp.]
MSTVAMFPGQGIAPSSVDREEIAQALPELLAACEALLACDPFAMETWPTSVAQPLIYVASLARWTMHRASWRADWLIGHSLGELTALVAAGALDRMDGLRLVVRRGQLTEQAAAAAPSPTGMLALGCDAATGETIAALAGAVVANDNAPAQVVLAGDAAALQRAEDITRERSLSCRRLTVGAAFHSPWMAGAMEPLAEELHRCTFAPPQIPVISCITCRPIVDPYAELSGALVASVRWRELVLTLVERGAERFEEVGPGTVLGKLVRRTIGRSVSVPAGGAR